MRHLDLFSGIGGFALAVDTVWGGSEHTFCDNNKFCQQVLKKHWPKAKIYGDIRKLTAKAHYGGQAEQKQQTAGYKQCDILTGGFPCQPFSQAGKRKGKEDDRYLWPEMLRVIKEFKPTWVIGENVAGILNMAEQQSDADMESQDLDDGEQSTEPRANGIIWGILDDLEQAGYSVQTFVIPACAVNAPHRRDRIWIVAHRTGDGRQRQRAGITVKKGHEEESKYTRIMEGRLKRSHSFATNSSVAGGQRRKRRERRERTQSPEKLSGRDNSREWEENWLDVATRLCGVDDGLPAGLDGFKLSKAGHRTERLKSLGNAIVPQVAIEIMKAIQDYER